MGMYINKMPDGTELPTVGKAAELLKIEGAKELSSTPKEWSDDIVCVVLNHVAGFEAAGYFFSPEELEAFAYQDGRPRRWLSIPNARELAK